MMNGWDEFEKYSNSRESASNSGNLFIKPVNNGTITLRLFSEPAGMAVAWTKDATGKAYKVINPSDELLAKINAGVSPDDQAYVKPRKRWMIMALDRKSNECGLYECPYQVMQSLAELRQMEQFGKNTAKYDVAIRMQKGSQPTYTVQGLPPSDLTSDQIEKMKAFKSRINIEDYVTSSVEEDVLRDLGLAQSSPAPSSTSNSSSDDDDDFFSSSDSGSSDSSEDDDFLDI